MSLTLYWMHCGGCGGDTHAFINAQSPDFHEFFLIHLIFSFFGNLHYQISLQKNIMILLIRCFPVSNS
jgi:Ni,Fe-hydrogenase I small subunit